MTAHSMNAGCCRADGFVGLTSPSTKNSLSLESSTIQWTVFIVTFRRNALQIRRRPDYELQQIQWTTIMSACCVRISSRLMVSE